MAGSPTMVPVPGGWFTMGCLTGRDEERPLHRVRVDPFEIGVFQVRNRDWAEYLEATRRPQPPTWRSAGFRAPDQPVTAVSWFEARAYCDWLTGREGRRYRLPTEAEWEFAARGGDDARLYPWGDTPPSEWPEHQARWSGDVEAPLPVGLASANSFGIYDIGENVHEWCEDWFNACYYASSPAENPRGPSAGTRRASRGGSWRHQVKASRCAARSSIPPEFQYADYGFRLVREAG
jgi:sulfatase modifying factor 1